MKTTEHTDYTEVPDGFLFKDEGYAILGACFEVYRELGCGFLEAAYQASLAIEFAKRKIPFEREAPFDLKYKGEALGLVYRPDFICFGKIVIEVKAVRVILPEHRAQLINYLKMSGLRVGYLVNFGHHPKVEFERIVL